MNKLKNGTPAIGAPGSFARAKAEIEDAIKGGELSWPVLINYISLISGVDEKRTRLVLRALVWATDQKRDPDCDLSNLVNNMPL